MQAAGCGRGFDDPFDTQFLDPRIRTVSKFGNADEPLESLFAKSFDRVEGGCTARWHPGR
jgi:hypothetical protein